MPPTIYRPIENPITGDRCQILEAGFSESGEGELRLLFWIAPGSQGAPLHFHQVLEESFRVIEGVMRLELDRKGGFCNLPAGASVVIAPGRLHAFANPGTEWLHFEARLRPPAGFLTFLLGMYGLAKAGKVDAEGRPKSPVALLRLLAFGDVWLPGIPTAWQRRLHQAAEWLSKRLRVEEELLAYPSALLQEASAEQRE